MPALWPTFIPAVGNYLNSTSSKKTHDEIAEKIASEYHKAVKTANTLVHPGNMPLVLGYMPSPSAPKPYTPIKNAIKKTLDDIKKSEGRPKLNHFSDWAQTTSTYWLQTKMSPTPFHPINIGLSTGTVGIPAPITHIINNGGVVPGLKAGLLKAFTHAPQKIPYGIPFATKLVNAFTIHLTTIGGLHTELVTPGTPITPLPPFPSPQPWVGMV